ncbi:hypothetical protein [Kordia sp.]|uniref:hypothetical protein n=1 Tax=Kordia sp. TaxID=1965332 RepID=UPI003D6B4CB5
MIKVGDYIKLKNKEYQNFYLKNKEWNDDYMYVGHFKHVCLWFQDLNCRGEYAKIFFDSSISKVQEIENDETGKPLFIKTDFFWMVYPLALEKNEIEVLNQTPEKIIGFENDKRTIEDVEFFEKEYKNGLFDVLERENNKHACYRRGFYFMKDSGKWEHITKAKLH